MIEISNPKELTNDELADILAESREYIEENGWGQGEFVVVENDYDDAGQEIIDYRVLGYCAVGGVLYSQQLEETSCSENPVVQQVSAALADALGLIKHASGECSDLGCSCVVNWVTAWNDNNNTFKQDVLDGFMKAEKIARGGDVA